LVGSGRPISGVDNTPVFGLLDLKKHGGKLLLEVKDSLIDLFYQVFGYLSCLSL
jgi:hypothetical protein